MKNKLLSEKLKELRKFNNYNQDYVASTLGVARQTYSHYETGNRTPSTTVLYKLAGLYNVSVNDFLQLTIEIDRDVNYDAPTPTESGSELSLFLEYFSNARNQKKYQYNTPLEKRLLYYFEMLSDEDKNEIIEFTRIKAHKNK